MDSLDRHYLSFLNQNNNIPTGLDSIASGLGDDSSMLEFVVEPYLIKIGFLTRTPRGRLLTALGKITLIQKMITFKKVKVCFLIFFVFVNIFYIAPCDSLSLREDMFKNALDLSSEGKFNLALEEWNLYLDSYPDDSAGLSNRGNVRLVTGDIEGSIDDQNKAISLILVKLIRTLTEV